MSHAALRDIRDIPTDLTVPEATLEQPAPGRRVRQALPGYEDSDVHHTLYLPTDWESGRRYPVLVEYAGNGPYQNSWGDKCSGTVEGCNLGYGISGGEGFLWLCLPYVSADHRHNECQWWGDVAATVDYCQQAVDSVCERWQGNRAALILTGFSRGAIACNYLGLHDDAIADLWLGFIAHSHYDGVRRWDYAGDEREAALSRLKRLRGRPQFISHEGSVNATQEYLESTGIKAPFQCVDLPYRNHTDTWVLRDIPERRLLRAWLRKLLADQ